MARNLFLTFISLSYAIALAISYTTQTTASIEAVAVVSVVTVVAAVFEIKQSKKHIEFIDESGKFDSFNDI